MLLISVLVVMAGLSMPRAASAWTVVGVALHATVATVQGRPIYLLAVLSQARFFCHWPHVQQLLHKLILLST